MKKHSRGRRLAGRMRRSKNTNPALSDNKLPYTQPIILVGMMGAGKTTVGRALAKALQRDFIDLDHAIEAQCGVPVATIFDIEGEEGFRRRETKMLKRYANQPGIVLATGGGAVVRPENRHYLSQGGVVVYLRATLSHLYQRLARDRSRPLLQTENPKQRLQDLLNQREPLYNELATVVFDTGNKSIPQTVRQLTHLLREARPKMITVDVSTPGGNYPICINPGRLSFLSANIPADASSIALITNHEIDTLYGEQVRAALKASGKPLAVIHLPEGENHKNWQTLQKIFDELLAKQFDRRSVLVALGGGVIGDITGFAAATFMRGVRFIQVPTTLLAQVDSSVGGKTAINHPLGKNMIGAFYQPIAVEIDTDVLTTLPKREISAGLAEVIKYGLIIDAGFFDWCEENAQRLLALEPQAIQYAIQRSCELKAKVVGLDEREGGVRAILNLGHTFGHAIETGVGYGQWLHGEAVGCGLVLAAGLSAQLLGLPPESVERTRALVEAIGCPTEPPQFAIERWVQLMRSDKKAQDGEMRFVLLSRIGEAVVQTVSVTALSQFLQEEVAITSSN